MALKFDKAKSSQGLTRQMWVKVIIEGIEGLNGKERDPGIIHSPLAGTTGGVSVFWGSKKWSQVGFSTSTQFSFLVNQFSMHVYLTIGLSLIFLHMLSSFKQLENSKPELFCGEGDISKEIMCYKTFFKTKHLNFSHNCKQNFWLIFTCCSLKII